MKETIYRLFLSEFSSVGLDKISEIVDKWLSDRYLEAIQEMMKLENGLGPVGIWTVELTNNTFRFPYPMKFDAIYRPLWYVYFKLFTSSKTLPHVTRGIVEDSCKHVEGCLKLLAGRKNVKNYERMSMVTLACKCRNFLPPELHKSIISFGKEICNVAKHQLNIETQDHLFKIEEMFAIYLIARSLGHKIIEAAGVTQYIENANKSGPWREQKLYIPST